ncbi:C2H2-type zinc finger protein [Nitrosococcus wardiae]|uniref:C2H2-type domain-containing protein n=1 Tax=Nitrosococcus wardiae TaxID=1814290 RepID=A0A4V1AVP2_9GAMM|nr:C2H2-type zinc finger protein [Nitrosococcus wardiae]QBQ53825.1 hypothetical protein E3U44_04340 [Nitrosococcus wardiae]
MPTVGWIQETAIDRYWERGGLGDQYPPTPKIHYCPYCTRQFESTGELSTHISVDHPIERPLLFIHNRVAYSEQTIRSPISKDDIDLTHVNRIKASKDGGEPREWLPDELKKHLSGHENGHYSITLSNSDPNNERTVEANYIVKIKIADQAELDAVDELFIRTLAIDDVRMSDVRRFSDGCAKYPGADEYASALAVYVTGVLIKDQNENTGVSRPLSVYKEKMQQALETLHDFDRPVPRAICASIKFNLNDFRNPPLPSGAELLDAANEVFATVTRGVTVQLTSRDDMLDSERELSACPIDRDSYDLLEVFKKIRADHADRSLIAELSASAIRRTLSDSDLSKLRVLTALAAIQTEDTAAGRPILEDLVNDPVFGSWAELQLEGEG